jgi:hypothetical protein
MRRRHLRRLPGGVTVASLIEADVQGLYTGVNSLSEVPPGSLQQADNVVLSAPGVMTPRRGFAAYGGAFGVITDRATSIGTYGGGYVVQYGASSLAHSTGGAAFTAYSGTYAPVSSTKGRMRFVEASQNLYVNTAAGVYTTDALATTPRLAGSPKPLGVETQIESLVGTTNWMSYDTAVAYRATICYKDANGNIVESAPCGRTVVSNRLQIPVGGLTRVGTDVTATIPTSLTGSGQFQVGDTVNLYPGEANFPAGDKTITAVVLNTVTWSEAGAAVSSTVAQDLRIDRAVQVSIRVPIGATPSHFYRVYRSEATASASDEPSDELFLAYEKHFTTTFVSVGTVTFNDTQPEELLGNPLYTNPNSGSGAIAGHEALPIARDIFYWGDRLCFLNTTQKHRLEIDIRGFRR